MNTNTNEIYVPFNALADEEEEEDE